MKKIIIPLSRIRRLCVFSSLLTIAAILCSACHKDDDLNKDPDPTPTEELDPSGTEDPEPTYNDYTFTYKPISNPKEVKLLLLVLDPKLSVGKTASEYVSHPQKGVIDAELKIMTKATNGCINWNVTEVIDDNEFARHKNQFKLKNGNYSYSLDEETYLDIMKNGFYGYWNNEYFKGIGDFSFDYEYYIKRYNLDKRRNKGEFDQVWIVAEPTANPFESIMVGRGAYWINGTAIAANCQPFFMIFLNLSRPECFIEDYGHAAENVLSKTFNYDLSYAANCMSVDKDNYCTLNLWQKFTLTEYMNKNKETGLAGPGSVHFSPNSNQDYDWQNYTAVCSKYKEWNQYPYLNDNPSTDIFTPDCYMKADYGILNSWFDATTRHHIWWFSLMPHVNGFTTDGYSNNWWTYLIDGQYVKRISLELTSATAKVGDQLSVITKSQMASSAFVTDTIDTYQENISFSDTTIIRIDKSGKMIARKKGTTKMTIYRDGKSCSLVYNIE